MPKFNTFSSLPYIPYNIIGKLTENENIWKILKYPEYDCLSKPNLTHKEKMNMIWKNQDKQENYSIFFTQLVENMIYDSTTILKLYCINVYPVSHLRAVVAYEFDVLYGGKISLIDYNGIPASRGDVFESELMNTLNGADINGFISPLQFNSELSRLSRSQLDLGNDKTYTGKNIVMVAQLSTIEEGGCG